VIIGLIIAVGIAIGAILFGLQAANTIPEALAKVLLEGCRLIVGQTLLFLAAILPLLAMAIPLYILRNRSEEIIIFGALYGLALALLTMVFGLQNYVVDLFRTSWYGGWVAGLSEIANAVYAVFYYVMGAFLFFIDNIIAFLIGSSKPLQWFKKNVTEKAIAKWKKHRPGGSHERKKKKK
jgi:MFS family permease